MKNSEILLSIIIFFIPLISGFLTGNLCKMGDDAGKTINARPPGYIFGIVWTILYLLLGGAWLYSRSKKKTVIVDILYILLIISLCTWVVIYGCKKDKKSALYIIPISMLITIFILIYTPNFYIAPLLVWLLFAFLLNFTEVNNLIV